MKAPLVRKALHVAKGRGYVAKTAIFHATEGRNIRQGNSPGGAERTVVRNRWEPRERVGITLPRSRSSRFSKAISIAITTPVPDSKPVLPR